MPRAFNNSLQSTISPCPLVGKHWRRDGEPSFGIDATKQLLWALWGEPELHAVGGGANQAAIDGPVLTHRQLVEVTHEGVVSFDALVLPVDPLLQRDGDASDATAIANRVTVMEPQAMAKDFDVVDVPVADVEADAWLLAVVAGKALVHQPFVAGGRSIARSHLVCRAAMVPEAAWHDDLLKIAVFQEVIKASNDGTLAFDQLLCRAEQLRLDLIRMQPVVYQITAKPDNAFAHFSGGAEHPHNPQCVAEQVGGTFMEDTNVVVVEVADRCGIDVGTAMPVRAEQQWHGLAAFACGACGKRCGLLNVTDLQCRGQLLLQAFDFCQQSILIAGLVANLLSESAVLNLQLRQCFLRVSLAIGAVPSLAIQFTAGFISIQQIRRKFLPATTCAATSELELLVCRHIAQARALIVTIDANRI